MPIPNKTAARGREKKIGMVLRLSPKAATRTAEARPR